MDHYISERRVINKLCAHWNNQRKEQLYPTKDSIKKEDIIEIWPYCFLIDIIEDKDNEKYHCSYIGEKATEIYQSDVALYCNMENITLFIPHIIDKLTDHLDAVIENQEPIIDCSETESSDGNYIKIRQCLLPLTVNNKKVDCIIGAVGGRIY